MKPSVGVYMCMSLAFFLHPLRIEAQKISTKNANILTTVISMSQKLIFVCDLSLTDSPSIHETKSGLLC